MGVQSDLVVWLLGLPERLWFLVSFFQGFPAGIDMIIPYENLTNDIDTVEQSVRHPKASDYNKFASKYKVLNTIADDAVVFIANEGCDIGTCNQISDRYGRHIQLTLTKNSLMVQEC